MDVLIDPTMRQTSSSRQLSPKQLERRGLRQRLAEDAWFGCPALCHQQHESPVAMRGISPEDDAGQSRGLTISHNADTNAVACFRYHGGRCWGESRFDPYREISLVWLPGLRKSFSCNGDVLWVSPLNPATSPIQVSRSSARMRRSSLTKRDMGNAGSRRAELPVVAAAARRGSYAISTQSYCLTQISGDLKPCWVTHDGARPLPMTTESLNPGRGMTRQMGTRRMSSGLYPVLDRFSRRGRYQHGRISLERPFILHGCGHPLTCRWAGTWAYCAAATKEARFASITASQASSCLAGLHDEEWLQPPTPRVEEQVAEVVDAESDRDLLVA